MNTVLIGMMGAGKSTVGRRLAEMRGLPFFDTDEMVAARAGRPIPELFEHEGEDGFRGFEAEAVAEAAAATDAVIAVGGGALMRPGNLAALKAGGRFCYLRARPETLRRRIGEGAGRPLAGRLQELLAEREPAYLAAADVVLDTDDVEADEVARRLARRVTVPLGPSSYDVVVGRGALSDLPPVDRAALIAPHPIAELYGADVEKALGGPGARIEIPDGEAAKAPAVLAQVWEELAEAGLARGDVIVGLGGGAATDVAGLAAATYLRGLPWMAVPTSLLGMVDAAIGGKTAVDLPQGKNLVGAFWHPSLVVCDTELLASLPEGELRSGWGEIVKYGLMADPWILEECAGGVRLPSDELVRRCVEIKARVVGADQREADLRVTLNYGHTFGHAIEIVSGLSHGEAVAVGLTAVAELGARAGRADVRAETAAALAALGLPTRAPGLPRLAVEQALRSDKKRDAGGLRFVLLEAIGQPVVVREDDFAPGSVAAALDAVL